MDVIITIEKKMPMIQAKRLLLNLLTNLNENISKKFSFVKRRKKEKYIYYAYNMPFVTAGVSRKSIISIYKCFSFKRIIGIFFTPLVSRAY